MHRLTEGSTVTIKATGELATVLTVWRDLRYPVELVGHADCYELGELQA